MYANGFLVHINILLSELSNQNQLSEYLFMNNTWILIIKKLNLWCYCGLKNLGLSGKINYTKYTKL